MRAFAQIVSVLFGRTRHWTSLALKTLSFTFPSAAPCALILRAAQAILSRQRRTGVRGGGPRRAVGTVHDGAIAVHNVLTRRQRAPPAHGRQTLEVGPPNVRRRPTPRCDIGPLMPAGLGTGHRTGAVISVGRHGPDKPC